MSRKSIMFMVVLIMAAFLFSAAWADSNKPKETGKEKQQVQKSNNDTNAEKDKDKQKNKEEKKIKEKPGQAETPGAGTKTKKTENWIPPGLSKEEKAEWINGRPPGWRQGQKTGWKGGSMPPGLAKKFNQPNYRPRGFNNWTEQQKSNWRRDLENTIEEIKERARKIKIFDLNPLFSSAYNATDQGVPVYWTRKVVDQSMDKGLNGFEIEQLTKAMSYGAEKNIDFNRLETFINKSIDNGVRGDELTLGVYKEIERLGSK